MSDELSKQIVNIANGNRRNGYMLAIADVLDLVSLLKFPPEYALSMVQGLAELKRRQQEELQNETSRTG